MSGQGQGQGYNFRQQANPYGRQGGANYMQGNQFGGVGGIGNYGGPPGSPVTYQSGATPYSGWQMPAAGGKGGGGQQPYAPATQQQGKGGGGMQAPQQFMPNTSNNGSWTPPTPTDNSGTPNGPAPPGMGWGIKPDGQWGWVQTANPGGGNFGTFGGLNPQNPYGNGVGPFGGGQSMFNVG